MKTLQRMIYSQVIAKVSFATAGFVGLFFFFDLANSQGLVHGPSVDGDAFVLVGGDAPDVDGHRTCRPQGRT